MFLFEIIQKILFLIGGIFIFFVLSFLLINTNCKIKDLNQKFDYIMYLTMILVFIYSVAILGIVWYIPLVVIASGYWIYKLFN